MKRAWTLAGWAALALALGALPGRAQSAPPGVGKPGRAAMYSADRRFMVSGLTSAENMLLAGKLAELARQVEECVGRPLPMQRDQVLGVMVQSGGAPDAAIMKVQGWDDGRFYQRLVVPNAVRLDEEDLFEAACWLLLNRYAADFTPAGQRTGLGAATPDWISCGMAQNAQAALKARNREWLNREQAEGRAMPLAQVIKLELLPSGRWREKAYAAAAVDFLFPAGQPADWQALFAAVGARQPIDAAWLRDHAAALQCQKPEDAWRAFLAERRRQRSVEAWSDRGLLLEERLLQVLNFRPRDFAPEIPADVPHDLFARDLIEFRAQSWVAPLAAALSLQVQSLKLGAPPALQEVLGAYAQYFDHLTLRPAEKHSWWQRAPKSAAKAQPRDDATWEVALNQLWARAERAHQNYLATTQSRKQYVDQFDRGDDGWSEPPPAAGDVPRTAIQKYMDEAEERLRPAR